MSQTTAEFINRARKRHQCDWCNERIAVGTSYERYRSFDVRDAQTVRLHPECAKAAHQFAAEDGGYAEWTAGGFSRGCCCEHGRCGCKKEPT